MKPQPPVLSIAPVTLTPRTPAERDALAAASGRDLVAERVRAVARVVGLAIVLFVVVRLAIG